MGYSFTDLRAEGCCRSLNALLYWDAPTPPHPHRNTPSDFDNKACHPGGNFWYYYPGVLSCDSSNKYKIFLVRKSKSKSKSKKRNEC